MKFLSAHRTTFLALACLVFLVNDAILSYQRMDSIIPSQEDNDDMTVRATTREEQRQLRGQAILMEETKKVPWLVATFFATLNSFWGLHTLQEDVFDTNLTALQHAILPSTIHNHTSRSFDNVQNETAIHTTQQSEPLVVTAPETSEKKAPLPSQATINELVLDDPLLKSTTPIPGEKTLAMYIRLYSGFRNEAMAFQAFVMHATENNFTQILLPSLYWKDLFGTKRPVEHNKLFDVEYWNSFYPVLPRMVEYNETLFPDWDGASNRFPDKYAELNATAPYAYGRYPRLISRYRTHLKWVSQGQANNTPAILAMQQALRPHPDMLAMQRNITQQSLQDSDETTSPSYMALHARIEPDMQVHGACWDKKVLRLQDVFDSLHRRFPAPPVDTLFIAVNRNMLEKEVKGFAKNNNTIAVENLKVLNDARDHGLWNGTVHVIEAGMPSLKGSRFEKYPGISGAMMDYYLALEATIFVGTEVSSFSSELVTNRFYRNNFESYHYRPEGLLAAVKEGDRAPPKFGC